MRSTVVPMLLAALSAGTLLAAPLSAQVAGDNVGTLTCTVADPAPSSESAKRAIRCAFQQTGGGGEQIYAGTISRQGNTPLPDTKVVLIWVVRTGLDVETKPGFLAQTYVGQPAAAHRRSVMLLVGQTNRNVVLQSSTATAGPEDDTVTVLELELRSLPA